MKVSVLPLSVRGSRITSAAAPEAEVAEQRQRRLGAEPRAGTVGQGERLDAREAPRVPARGGATVGAYPTSARSDATKSARTFRSGAIERSGAPSPRPPAAARGASAEPGVREGPGFLARSNVEQKRPKSDHTSADVRR